MGCQLELSSRPGRRRLTFGARRGQTNLRATGRRTRWRAGGRWKSQNRRNVYLSPYVEEPLNSKVIKSFVPELRSRVFRVSRFLCSMYICYEQSMYVSHIRTLCLFANYPADLSNVIPKTLKIDTWYVLA